MGTCTARWASDPQRVCGAVEVGPGQNRCLAHHPDFANLLAEAVTGGRVELRETEINGPLIGALGHQATAGSPFELDCTGSTFTAELSLPGAHLLRECTFDEATFAEGVDFDNASFADDASFYDAKFPRGGSFKSTRFDGSAWFGRSEWGIEDLSDKWGFEALRRAANFYEAQFGLHASFQGATFWSIGSFSRACFTRSANFTAVKAPHAPVWTFQNITIAGAIELGITLRTDARSVLQTDPDNARYWVPADARPDVERGSDDPGQPSAVVRRAAFGSVVLRRTNWDGPTSVRLEPDGAGLHLLDTVVDHPVTIRTSPRHRAAQDRSLPAIDGIVECVLEAPLILAEVSLKTTRFDHTTGLDQLRLTGPVEWPRRAGLLADRQVIAADLDADDAPDRPQPVALELTYRQLRAGLESSKAAPAAADFYVGELNARRRAAPPRSIDRMLLFVYRWVGGYGVRPIPPLCWLVALIIGTTVVVRVFTDGIVRSGTTLDQYDLSKFWDALAFVTRNSISILSAPAAGLTAGGTLLFIFERYTAVTLLTLTVFAIRSRVAR